MDAVAARSMSFGGAKVPKGAQQSMRRNFVLPAGRSADLAKDSDGEELKLCPECRLPIGDFGYATSGKAAFMHGECKAQVMLREAKADEEARQRSDANLKKMERSKYNIGWKKELIPRNMDLAGLLEGQQIPQGMCCLMLKGSKLCLLPTLDPAASINLEYLSLALRVRATEGREPLFSLDLTGAPTRQSSDVEDLWQVKRFEPEWLQGTSVGEVMFQADYHLKELSMGEHQQPVVGMASALDLAKDSWHEQDWRAREWFVVNQAEIRATEGGILIPHVQMGVEAREQTLGPDGLEDAKITRSEHPLVKYAEAFTHNFDLIAERKSSVFHLRELAKASVLAKYLLDTQVEMEDSWFELIKEVKQMTKMEIPQLWNQRTSSQVNLKDGKILDAENGMDMGTRGVYGGISMGLDKFDLGATTMQPGAGEAPYSLLFSAADRGAVMARGVVTPPSLMEPRGVDLNLNKFDLTQTVVAGEAGEVSLGQAFWSNVDCKQGSVFKAEDKELLAAVFDSQLSDRREDGELFVPPEMRQVHLDRLRALVKEEAQVAAGRKQHFLSEDFAAAAPGPLFPSSWGSSFDLAQAAVPTAGVRCEQPDQQAVARAMKTAAAFDKTAEDGTCFRVYRADGLEVRTTRSRDGEELVGAVFTSGLEPVAACQAATGERITKAVEYVEKASGTQKTVPDRHYYVVFETEKGDRIATEKRADGTIAWRENPSDLEARNKLAKVINSVDKCDFDISDIKAAACGGSSYAASSERKRFAHGIFQKAKA